MTTTASLQEAIARERRQRETDISRGQTEAIAGGNGRTILDDLLFFTPPDRFPAAAADLQQQLKARFGVAGQAGRINILRFLAEAALSLGSFLPRWNLQNTARHGDAALNEAQTEAGAAQFKDLALGLAAEAPAASILLAAWQAEATARYQAEGVSTPESEAQTLIGAGIGDYLSNRSAELAGSHLRRLAELRDDGHTPTELSNDYAAFLQHTLYLGASFVTCNPPLIDIAWQANPDHWTPRVDNLIAQHPQADPDSLARLVTLEIVLDNMRLLRPIFLLTSGQMGCVSLQVNPKKHDDAETMIADALSIYETLQARLAGGVPNVVFKLPATQAGLAACTALTSRGIGVNITVNFSLFQHLPFARAIAQGQAIFACLAHMSGRLAYPVRDELLGKLNALAAHDLDETQVRLAAAWSGVAVLKRLHRLLNDHGYDLGRVRPLVASLRIYQGDGYEGLPNPFPDITETVGTRILSVFPNVRRAFDTTPAISLDPRRVATPVPEAALAVLTHSEIFKQAYYVADPAWGGPDDPRFRPERVLTLADEAGTAAWPPAHNTLNEFNRAYDTFVERIVARKNGSER